MQKHLILLAASYTSKLNHCCLNHLLILILQDLINFLSIYYITDLRYPHKLQHLIDNNVLFRELSILRLPCDFLFF